MTDETHTFKVFVQQWTDIDLAAYYLAQCIGLLDKNVSFSKDAKHIFWSNNAVGNAMYAVIDELVSEGILESRDEPDYQVKWGGDQALNNTT